MSRPQAIGNDDVERHADRLCTQVTENALAPGVPEADNSIPVDGEKTVGRAFHETPVKIYKIHNYLHLPPAMCRRTTAAISGTRSAGTSSPETAPSSHERPALAIIVRHPRRPPTVQPASSASRYNRRDPRSPPP